MNLKNITIDQFVEIFGEEAKDMVTGYECDLLVINNATARAIGITTGFSACVVPMIYTGETTVTRVFILNYEAFYNALPFIDRMSKEFVCKAARGQLVHELTHVKQEMEGRLVNDATGTYWEGVKYEITPGVHDAYYTTPWEKEAYINQFMYELDCGPEEAEKAFIRTISSLKAA